MVLTWVFILKWIFVSYSIKLELITNYQLRIVSFEFRIVTYLVFDFGLFTELFI